MFYSYLTYLIPYVNTYIEIEEPFFRSIDFFFVPYINLRALAWAVVSKKGKSAINNANPLHYLHVNSFDQNLRSKS